MQYNHDRLVIVKRRPEKKVQSSARVGKSVLLYDGPLLCGFNVAIKELMASRASRESCKELRRYMHASVLDDATAYIQS